MELLFKIGFEKVAAAKSLIGIEQNITPGLKKYEHGGKIAPPNTVSPGESIAPRSDAPPLPTMAPHSTKRNLDAVLPNTKLEKVKIPKPKGFKL